MRLTLCIASLWPGLVQAWCLGSSRGLGLAIVFAAALNAAMVATFVWPQWPLEGAPAGTTAVVAWSLVLGLMVLGMRWTRRDMPKLASPTGRHDPQIDEWLREAQHEYLKGHWISAESLLSRLLARQPQDVEARLLLASVQRRSGQWNQAKRTIAELSQSPSASRWQMEIESEREQIAEVELESTETEDSAPETSVRDAA